MNARHTMRLGVLMLAVNAAAGTWSNSLSVSILQSSAASSAGAITGVVVDAQSGEPIGGALVYLSREGRGTVGRQSRQRTDGLGRFAFTDLPAFDGYSVSTSAPGYFNGGFSLNGDAGSKVIRLNLNEGQWIGDVHVPMWRPAVISGTVVDESGDPIVGALVRALADFRIAGTTHLASGPEARTDDRGAYRMPGVPPGRYRLSVPFVQASVPTSSTPPAYAPPQATLRGDNRARLVLGRGAVPPPPETGTLHTYPMSFYGGATAAEAAVVEVNFGTERTGIDIQVMPTSAVRLSGAVDGPPEVRAGLLMRLVTGGLDELGAGSETATAYTEPDGTFVFLNVPSGQYVIVASTLGGGYGWNAPNGPPIPPPGGLLASAGSITDAVRAGPPGVSFTTLMYGGADRRYGGQATVSVGATDVSGVTVPLTRAARVSGRLVIDPDPTRPAPAPPAFLSVSAEPADGRATLGWPSNRLRPDTDTHEFLIDGLLNGEYVLRGVAPAGWIVKSITYDSRDYTSTPIDGSSGTDFTGVVVTFTNRVPVLAGTVRDGSGTVVPDAAVIAFPVEPAQWHDYGLNPVRIQATDAARDGTYRLTTLPAGAYYLVAVPGGDIAAWQDPDFFPRMAQLAVRIDIGWGVRQTVDLKVAK